MEDERTLQATFTGSVSQQVGLHLLQAGQQGAAGAAGGEAAGQASLFCTFTELLINPPSPDVRTEEGRKDPKVKDASSYSRTLLIPSAGEPWHHRQDQTAWLWW